MSGSNSAPKDQLLQLWHSVAEVAGFSVPEGCAELEEGAALSAYIWSLCDEHAVHAAEFPQAVQDALVADGQSMAPFLRIRLVFACCWFDRYLESLNVEPELLDAVCSLRPAFLCRALSDDDMFVDSQHVFARLLQSLAVNLPAWYAGQGRAGEKLVGSLQALLQAIKANADGAIADYLNWQQKESARSDTQRQRCVEREVAQRQTLKLQAQVWREFNSKVAGGQWPEFVDEYVRGQLVPELQFVLINTGEQHPLWVLWKRLFLQLPKVFSLDAEDKQQLYDAVQGVVSALEPPLQVSPQAQSQYDEFVVELTTLMFSLLRGEAVDTIEAVSLQGEDEEAGVTRVSRALLRQVAVIREGDWFLLESQSEGIIRCQLALKLIDDQRLVFVNRSGIKVAEKSVEEFALCLSSRVARTLTVAPLFEACSVKAVSFLRELYDLSLGRYKEEQRQQQLMREQQLQAEEEAKRLRLEAAEKARREAEQLAELERQRQIEHEQAMQLELANERQRRRAEAVRAVDDLKVGSWLQLPGKSDAQELVRAKLAVAMPSTGKHIFVDRLGLTLAEYYRDELIEMLEQQSAQVMTSASSFEGQLSKVVKGLRKDVSG